MQDDQQRQQGPLGGIGEGLRTGIGILNAFREAAEEALGEAMERGDLTPERAKALVRDAAGRVQSSLGETRERFDFVSRREMDELRAELARLRTRVAALEGRASEDVVEGAAAPPPSEPTTEGGIILPE